MVPQPLFEDFRLRKTAVGPAVPDGVAVALHHKDAASAGNKSHFADFLTEGLQELLRHPGGAQHPAALRAVFDGDPRFWG